MAINQEDNGTQRSKAAPQSTARDSGTAGVSGKSEVASLSGLNSIFRARIARTQGSAILGEWRKKITDLIVDSNAEGYELVDLDRETLHIPYSCLVIVQRITDGGINVAAAHTLILEGSGPKLEDAQLNDPTTNRSIRVIRTTGDAYNDRLKSLIRTTVLGNYGTNVNQVQFIDAGVQVVNSEADVANLDIVRAILHDADDALVGSMEQNPTFTQTERFSVSMFGNRTALTARVDYNSGQVSTAGSLPVRSDIAISLTGTANEGAEQYQVNQKITTANTFVDLSYHKEQPTQYDRINQNATKQYLPRLVITNLSSDLPGDNLELQLLALSTTFLLANPLTLPWAGVFRPNYADKSGLQDLGAIGYEWSSEIATTPGVPVPAMGKIDTRSDTFTDENRIRLLRMACHDDLVISIDVSETDSKSWLTSAFTAAAAGNPEAYNAIIKAADTLTDGRFSPIFANSQNKQIVVSTNNKIHLGYYTDRDSGELRDIREIGYLAILNFFGAKNPEVAKQWGDSFDDVTVPLEIRMEARTKIFDAMFGNGSVQYKGIAERLNISPAFAQAFAQALEAAGLAVRPANIISSHGAIARGSNLDASFAMGGFNTNVFQNNYGNTAVRGGNFYNKTTSRFS